MKLDRNINSDGKGKYALINLRTNKVEWGVVDSEEEFFVLKLKDRHSMVALIAYANSVREIDQEFADEVLELVARSGPRNQWCKEPD